MPIRTRLAITFIAIFAFIMIGAAQAIFFFSSDYREEEFYSRLINKANTTATLLLDVEEVSIDLLRIITAKDAGVLPSENITIYNYKNDILYTTDTVNAMHITPELIDQVRLDKEVRYKQDSLEVVGVLFTSQYDRFVVFASAMDRFGLSKLKNLRTVLLFVFGFSMIIVVVAGSLFSNRVLLPIKNVIKDVESIDYSNMSKRLGEGNGTDEIALLTRTFNKMLDRLEASLKMQRHFVSNASHELRTPLTAISGQLEVLLMKDRTTQDYKTSMTSILEDINSLNRTSNRLLLLAQASAENAEASFTEVRVDDMLWQAESELHRRKPEYKIDIVFEEMLEDEQALIVRGNDQLIKTAILNLMENACKFSSDNRVVVSIATKPRQITLTFKDNGIGIKKEDIPHIFEPFYRSTAAISVNGHGIGLSLVDRVANLHKGGIRVQSEVGKGSVFTLLFPTSR
ncbi:HAMP domain-containing sensor histidine kinase [soil metagenome]